jgi:trimethylamine--corrinoid protein Co-methyltransferase
MIPRIQPPPESEIEAIHAASLRVLEEVGVVFPDREARELLADAGADVHADSGLVKFPARLVEEALTSAPRDILLAGRDPVHDVRCDGSDTFLTLDGTGAYTLDHRSGERRASTLQDLADACRIADAAPEVSVVWNIVSASDATPATQVIEELAACVSNTSKHVQGEVQRAVEVPYVMEILAAASEGGRWDAERPDFSIVYCPVPPLQHEPEMLAAAVALAREGVPMCVYSMGLAGATAPITLAGAAMQANAEILSSIVLFQLVRPGLPCIYVADTGVLDMRAGIYAAAPPESLLLTQAMVALARRYDLPVMATGLTGDANQASMMSGVDAALTALASMLMEPDLLVGAGMHGGAQTLSLPKILLDCEIFRECRRVRAGMSVDDEHLMTGVVADVGPGGHFLKARQTRQFMRSGELYVPDLMLREPYEAWRDGKQAEVGRAVAAVEQILATHRVEPLPPGADAKIADVVTAAGRELGGR